MPDWETKQAEHERRDAELRPFNKTVVFDALAAAGITIVVVAFDGYGDSGQIENVEAKAGEDVVALPSGEVEIASAVWDQTDPERTAMTVHDAIERLVFDFLGMDYDGWENSDGAYEGPGIPRSEREKVFEPFYRIDSARDPSTGGVGLGLSVMRSIVWEHGGDVTLGNRKGGGLSVRVELPIATVGTAPHKERSSSPGEAR